MIIKIKCPSCNEKLSLDVINEKIVSISVGNSIETSEDKINKLLKDRGIELA